MSLRKLTCMFAVAVCACLFSARSASACASDRPHHDAHDHAAASGGHLNHSHAAAHARLRSSTEGKRVADAKAPAKGADALPSGAAKAARPAGSAAPALQDDEEYEGGCIHANGCTCSGRRSHSRYCGSGSGDCHAHPGLVCTWGGMLIQ